MERDHLGLESYFFFYTNAKYINRKVFQRIEHEKVLWDYKVQTEIRYENI